MKKYVFMFDETENPNTPKAILLLGNKGAQLAEMTKAGLRVPYGFTVSTEACNEFYENEKSWPEGLEKQVNDSLDKLEKKMDKSFGNKDKPLFVSVRSGSYVSMPGMMDTVLNLGMNDETVEAFAELTKNPRAAWDSYRRFINMFGDVVMGVEHSKFEAELESIKKEAGVEADTELSTDDLKKVVEKYKALVQKEKGESFPHDPKEQLRMGINAVFSSWNVPRAIAYRKINQLKNNAGTGVNIQAMVFGNMGDDSGTGVSFTRNPANGNKEHYGEFLINAQGEDVVAGIRTPQPIDELGQSHPAVYKELLEVYEKLEKHYADLQDFEFTFEKETLFLLQTRKGKRTAQAALKIAIDMHKEGLISKEQAVLNVKPEQLDQLLHKQFDQKSKETGEVIAKGLPASPGAAIGKIVFTAEAAAKIVEENKAEAVILVRTETSPEDIEGMNAAKGILTARGGMTSHAAVVARGMGKCCVAGCEEIIVDEHKKELRVKNKALVLKENDLISLDGSTGEVFKGELALVEPEVSGTFAELMSWADEFRTMKVKTNADTPKDALRAKEFGAEGIGLCRTEHMFFEAEKIKEFRKMILTETKEEREKALLDLEPLQEKDFFGLFEVMDNLPIIIRLLDPPLHEFLPKEDGEINEIAKELGIKPEKIKEIESGMHEFNPMLGFRGCRLGVSYPEINAMQAKAIFKAALKAKEKGLTPLPRIEVPLVGNVKEFTHIKKIIEKVAENLGVKGKIDYQIGTMIEVPRACITADEIAKEADFLSFGTNDLTQMGCGFSRDDAGKFLPLYVSQGIYERDPFQAIDQTGVGELMKICIQKARSVKPEIEIGICGEHGGEPSSVEFCHRIGLNDVSCSPFRVPIARLAAAQAAIKEKLKK